MTAREAELDAAGLAKRRRLGQPCGCAAGLAKLVGTGLQGALADMVIARLAIRAASVTQGFD